jgi:16S rRNA (cytosine1402-N4)-methyltransferase
VAEHIPVLVGAALAAFDRELALAPVVDGTCGLGGHCAALLDRFAALRVVGLDRDPQAVATATGNLRRFGERAVVRHGRFGGWAAELRALGVDSAAGLMLDLGVSSPQLDVAGRGFSFNRDGPLDMRMDPGAGMTALEFLHHTEESEIAHVLWTFGEERLSRRIARGIKQALREQRLETTGQLAEICRKAYPRGPQRIDPATRTFQALRIVVNDELRELERALASCPDALAAPAVMCVISFHSLEDRIVKHTFRKWKSEGRGIILKPDPAIADESEREANPRSRSAKLRAFVWGSQLPQVDAKQKYRSKHHR